MHPANLIQMQLFPELRCGCGALVPQMSDDRIKLVVNQAKVLSNVDIQEANGPGTYAVHLIYRKERSFNGPTSHNLMGAQ
ncbi:hypothetical protein N7535_007781 [Penicillium sp. DV-2018c]|nr:hypothetical protein N7461_003816 [Penicillium sp. DV-2018c]KAJ5566143.1 hypothetical protein N7535_007781 [Penicillium sp. DV-2018c]